MKKVSLTLTKLLLTPCFLLLSCSSGETDKKTEVNTSENIDLKKDKTVTDSTHVDSLNHW